jgi:hypothetical protein
MFPEIAKEWHPTKNGKLTPSVVIAGGNKKVWWLCTKGHSYESSIYSRVGKQKSGCTYCAGKKVSKDNSLQFNFPKIAKEWHPIKNKELTPEQVTKGSGKVVWWLCTKGHSYEKVVRYRTRKNPLGCPYCSKRKIPK